MIALIHFYSLNSSGMHFEVHSSELAEIVINEELI